MHKIDSSAISEELGRGAVQVFLDSPFCDNDSWIDTWFAEHMVIFNIGVYPYVEARLAFYPADQRLRII